MEKLTRGQKKTDLQTEGSSSTNCNSTSCTNWNRDGRRWRIRREGAHRPRSRRGSDGCSYGAQSRAKTGPRRSREVEYKAQDFPRASKWRRHPVDGEVWEICQAPSSDGSAGGRGCGIVPSRASRIMVLGEPPGLPPGSRTAATEISSAEESLLGRRQNREESMDSYAYDILSRCHKLGKAPRETIAAFIRGLLPEIKGQVAVMQPQTMEEAERIDRTALTYATLTPAPATVAAVHQAEGPSLDTFTTTLQQLIAEMQTSPPARGQYQPRGHGRPHPQGSPRQEGFQTSRTRTRKWNEMMVF